jgi:hypothetical protein
MISRSGYKILKVDEGGVMLIIDMKKKALLKKFKAVLINN